MGEVLRQLYDGALFLVHHYGYWGILALSLTVFIYQPVAPDIFIVGEVGLGLHPVMTATVALAGTVAGTLVGHLLGGYADRLGLHRLRENKYGKRIHQLFHKYGLWAVAIAALTPIPLRETSWIAGIFHYPRGTFALAVTLGLAPRYYLEALFGRWLYQLIH